MEAIRTYVTDYIIKNVPFADRITISFTVTVFNKTQEATLDDPYTNIDIKFFLFAEIEVGLSYFKGPALERCLPSDLQPRWVNRFLNAISSSSYNNKRLNTPEWIDHFIEVVNYAKPYFPQVDSILYQWRNTEPPPKRLGQCYDLLRKLLEEEVSEKEKDPFYHDEKKSLTRNTLFKIFKDESVVLFEHHMRYFAILDKLNDAVLGGEYKNNVDVLLLLTCYPKEHYYYNVPCFSEQERLCYYLYHKIDASFRNLLYKIDREQIALRVSVFKMMCVPQDLACVMLRKYLMTECIPQLIRRCNQRGNTLILTAQGIHKSV